MQGKQVELRNQDNSRHERAVEILGQYTQGKEATYDPSEVSPYLDLLTAVQECPRKRRQAMLEQNAPEIAKQVRRWLENPNLYRLVNKVHTHAHYGNTEAPEIDWIIEGVLESNGTAMFYGDSGIGKTFIAMHMAACIGSGSQWFGAKTSRRRVLYLDGENGKALMHRRAQMVGYDDADVSYISFPQTQLDDDGLKLLRLLIRELEAEVVVIDPLVNSMEGDENTVEDVRPQIKGLRALAESEG
ncbi:MAG: AAA family ATPase [bacterium]